MVIDVADIASERDHTVRFYGDDGEFVRTVARDVLDSLLANREVILIATTEHRRAITTELDRLDPGRRVGRDALSHVDAWLALGVVRDEHGALDPGRALSYFETVLSACSGEAPPVIHSELVSLLFEQGEEPTALMVESLWNRLALSRPFRLMCPCSVTATFASERRQELSRLCDLHPGIIHPEPGAVVADGPNVAWFAPARNAPYRARHFVSGVLDAWGCSSDVQELAALVTSELASNVVLHARSAFSVSVERTGTTDVTVSVCDQASGTPQPTVDPHHGLGIVASLAHRWGVARTDATTTVWAELR